MSGYWWLLYAVLTVALLAWCWVFARWALWPLFRARRAGIQLTLLEVIGMRILRVRVDEVVEAARLTKGLSGAPSLSKLQTHDLAMGDVLEVAQAFAEMRRLGMAGDWEKLTSLSLGGYDTLAALSARVDLDQLARTDDKRFRKRRFQ